jgi:AcrR family transcriptional regulator
MAKAEYRSALRSRKLIIDALADILQEKPLDKITVTEVVARAGINRGTFYAHYADVPDVIHHLIDDTFSQIRDAISTLPPRTEDLPRVLLTQVQQILEADLNFYQKVLSSSASTFLQEQLVNILLEYILQQVAMISPEMARQSELMIRFCAGGLASLYRDWFAGKLPISLDALTEQACALASNLLEATSLSIS